MNLSRKLNNEAYTINIELRIQAGFSPAEIEYLQQLRESFLDKGSVWKKK